MKTTLKTITLFVLGIIVLFAAVTLFSGGPFKKDGENRNEPLPQADSVLPGNTAAPSASSYLAALKSTLPGAEVPYFWDLYNQDPVFRKNFLAAIKKENINKPDWVPGGVASPVEEAENGFLKSSVCEPHNCPHAFYVEYSPESKQLVGFYQRDSGDGIFFGDDLPEVRTALCASYQLDCQKSF
ncbi:MAG: inhibitor of vertebrate lysozyme family protein [Burkholderiales bacterium]|nr:inhibitor of vertebrate lysozyme family protein [Burkholderiales bacterium]